MYSDTFFTHSRYVQKTTTAIKFILRLTKVQNSININTNADFSDISNGNLGHSQIFSLLISQKIFQGHLRMKDD